MTKGEYLESVGIRMSGNFDRSEEADEEFREAVMTLADRFNEIYEDDDDEP